jgi:hypothetical protein
LFLTRRDSTTLYGTSGAWNATFEFFSDDLLFSIVAYLNFNNLVWNSTDLTHFAMTELLALQDKYYNNSYAHLKEEYDDTLNETYERKLIDHLAKNIEIGDREFPSLFAVMDIVYARLKADLTAAIINFNVTLTFTRQVFVSNREITFLKYSSRRTSSTSCFHSTRTSARASSSARRGSLTRSSATR